MAGIDISIEVIDIVFFVWLIVITKAEFNLFKKIRKLEVKSE